MFSRVCVHPPARVCGRGRGTGYPRPGQGAPPSPVQDRGTLLPPGHDRCIPPSPPSQDRGTPSPRPKQDPCLPARTRTGGVVQRGRYALSGHVGGLSCGFGMFEIRQNFSDSLRTIDLWTNPTYTIVTN